MRFTASPLPPLGIGSERSQNGSNDFETWRQYVHVTLDASCPAKMLLIGESGVYGPKKMSERERGERPQRGVTHTHSLTVPATIIVPPSSRELCVVSFFIVFHFNVLYLAAHAVQILVHSIKNEAQKLVSVVLIVPVGVCRGG